MRSIPTPATVPRRAARSVSTTRGSGTTGSATCRGVLSIPRVPRRSRKRNDVAHVGKSGRVSNRPLEAQPETRVRHRAVAAQVAIPAVMFLVEAGLADAGIEYVEALLALAAADDFTDA